MKSLTRVVSSTLAASVAALVVGAAPAGASTSGVGTTSTKTSVVTFQLGQNGSLLNLGLLTDVGAANTDSHGGALKASNSLVPITLASPALHLDLSTPAISTAAPGGQSDATSQAITLSGLGVPPAIATATIKPAVLHSDFSTSAAHSTMTAAEVDNLTLLGGGLASIDLLSSSLGADALSSQAAGVRGVNIGTIKLLDLGALLKGIGADLTTLPVGTLSGLLSKLGLPVAGLPAGANLADQVTSLSTALTGLRTTLTSSATSSTTSAVDTAASSALGKLGVPVPAVGTLVTTVNSEITTLQNTLTGLLSNAASALDTFPLVQVAGEQAGIGVKAADTLGHSSASTLFSPLKVIVAGQALNIDLQAVAATINSTVDAANGALNGLLGQLGLPTNLVTVKLLEKATNVSMNGAYTSAVAGLSVLHVGIAAISPAVVSNALSTLSGPSITSLLNGTPLSSVLGASNAMASVAGLLGTAAPLLGGAQLQVASLAGESTYTFAPATAPSPAQQIPTSLPHTGGSPELAIIGVVLAGLAIAGLRFARMSRLQPARVTTKSD
jgi:hypothetical protein